MRQEVALVGFDSAWTDNPRKPGSVCGLTLASGKEVRFFPPRPANFRAALDFIHELSAQADCTIVALDQPTIVPNGSGLRPVERAAGSLIGWLGGGVQPSNRGRMGMFDETAPIWAFLSELGAVQNPQLVRNAKVGLYLAEVFPAMALPSLDPMFYGRKMAPRYNPERKTFRHDAWLKVVDVVAREFGKLGVRSASDWCRSEFTFLSPKKAHQDALDALICLLIAIRWRLADSRETGMLGDLDNGYMVLPLSQETRIHLAKSALAKSVPFVEMI